MPCDSSHLEPDKYEVESKKIASLIIYVNEMRPGSSTPGWITQAAYAYYGNSARIHKLTDLLCGLCKSMSEEEKDRIIYDGRSPKARQLADWWEAHQKADKIKQETKPCYICEKQTQKRLSTYSVCEQCFDKVLDLLKALPRPE